MPFAFALTSYGKIGNQPLLAQQRPHCTLALAQRRSEPISWAKAMKQIFDRRTFPSHPFYIATTLLLAIACLMPLTGFLAGRNQSAEGYNLDNRKLPLIGYIVSYGATFIGVGFFITGTAYAYLFGIGLLWSFLGMIFGILVFGFFASWLKKNTESQHLYTLPDLFRWRFDDKAALTLAFVALILLIGDVSIRLIAGGKLLESLDVLSYHSSVIITVIVVNTYLVLSGFRDVIWTDYILLTAIVFLTISLAVSSMPHFNATPEQLDLFRVPLPIIAGFFLFGLFGPFSISTYYQRVVAAATPSAAKYGTWISALVILLRGAAFFIIGMIAKSMFPAIDPDTAFLNMMKFGGTTASTIGAMVLWAALMSTVDTLAFAGSQILNNNILHTPLSQRNVARGLLGIFLFATTIAFLVPSVTSVALLFLAGGMTIAPSAFLQWFVKSLPSKAVIASMLCGMLSMFTYALCFKIGPTVILVALVVSFVVIIVEMAFTRPSTNSSH